VHLVRVKNSWLLDGLLMAMSKYFGQKFEWMIIVIARVSGRVNDLQCHMSIFKH
jgi:hypothetical protein